MDDALACAKQRHIGDTELGDVPLERGHLDPAFRLRDRPVTEFGRNIVVGDRDSRLRPPDPAPRFAQAFECLRARYLVHEMAVDIEEDVFAAGRGHDMRVPDFLEDRAGSSAIISNGQTLRGG